MIQQITIFHAQKSSTKLPQSPYGDNSFVFETYGVQNNFEMFSIMVNHYMLNIPLAKINKPIRTFRRKINLEPYYNKTVNYLILDIDDVKSDFNKEKILNYFKDYKVILGQSKSYNGIDNFNMKGFLFSEEINIDDLKSALSFIHHDLKELCTIDEAVVRKATLNAPILKNKVFLNNEDGILFKYVKRDAIEHINDIKKEYVGESIAFPIEKLETIEADSMEKLCLSVFQLMGFEAIKNNPNDSITFKHPTETKTPGGFFWFSSSPYTMHHFDSTKTVNIFENVRKLKQAKDLMRKEINYDDEFLKFNTDTSVISVNEKFLKVTPEINNKIQLFLNNSNGLMSIRSPMGTGKSTIIKNIVDEAHDVEMKVLIITNRISVANDFAKKYNMKIYNKDKYEIGDSLICQYDSLWKYNIKYFDIVIMDEFISLMMHSRSNLNNSSFNIAKFFGSFNKKLVIADAFLSGFENFLLSNKTKNVHMIDNIYRDPTVLFNYTNQNNFVDSISIHAKKHKITVSATSLSFIYSLKSLLTKKGLNVVTLTADTPESTKELIYDLFDKEDHDKWDVLIYSPTLTVGVSNLNNVRYHFHYDGSNSTDVISSIQMIKRTRKTKEIHMFVKEKTNYLKTSYDELRDEYMTNIGKNIDQNYLFDIDDYGEAKLSEIGKKALKIDTFKNILEFNHKSAFVWLLKYHFLKEPVLIDKKMSSNILMKYQKELKRNNDMIIQNNIDEFLLLNDIEKDFLLESRDNDDKAKVLKKLADINYYIKDAPKNIKTNIINYSLKDNSFITKCKYYKIASNYTKLIYDADDVKYIVSECIKNNNTDDLGFYNSLLNYGQKEIFESYTMKAVNSNKKLKYILDKCGYKSETTKSIASIGNRSYSLPKEILENYMYIK